MDLSNLLADNSSERAVTVKVKPSNKLPKDLGDMMNGSSTPYSKRPVLPEKHWWDRPDKDFKDYTLGETVVDFGKTAIALPMALPLFLYMYLTGQLDDPYDKQTTNPGSMPYSGIKGDNMWGQP